MLLLIVQKICFLQSYLVGCICAEGLIGKIDFILERVAELMAGVGQVALCIVPAGSDVDREVDLQNLEKVPPDCLACKIFTIICADAATDR